MSGGCATCGSEKHNLYRFFVGWICFRLYMTLPDSVIFGGRWRFWQDMFLPNAGDYMYDARHCSHEVLS